MELQGQRRKLSQTSQSAKNAVKKVPIDTIRKKKLIDKFRRGRTSWVNKLWVGYKVTKIQIHYHVFYCIEYLTGWNTETYLKTRKLSLIDTSNFLSLFIAYYCHILKAYAND